MEFLTWVGGIVVVLIAAGVAGVIYGEPPAYQGRGQPGEEPGRMIRHLAPMALAAVGALLVGLALGTHVEVVWTRCLDGKSVSVSYQNTPLLGLEGR